MVPSSARYFAFTRRSIQGPLHPRDIALLPGFGRATLVCPEAALGQWKEAQLEAPFRPLLDFTPREAQPHLRSHPAQTPETVDNRALRSLLEKAILKNSRLDNEVKALKRDYAGPRKQLEEEVKKKDAEIRELTEKLNKAATTPQPEHPSWEQLYKTFKKRADDRFFETTEALAEKREEVQRLKNQIQSMVDAHENSRREARERKSREYEDNTGELASLRSALEEKETAARAMAENLQSVLRKNEELQRIMLDERKDYETRNLRFCEEIGCLKGELNRKQLELEQFAAELRKAREKLREFESAEDLKDKEQKEMYGVLHAKIRILTGYFDNLESRLKYAFRKA